MGRFQRADYRWRLLADPPVCRDGRPEMVLNNCELVRRGQVCWCRFESADINEDLEAIGAAGAADDWLTAGDLEARDVEELRDAIRAILERASKKANLSDDESAAVDRLLGLAQRLDRVVERESGLSDRYADDVD